MPYIYTVAERWSGAMFQFMFFDALNPTYLKGFRAFYVFYPVFMDFRENSASANSGSTLPKDKAASR